MRPEDQWKRLNLIRKAIFAQANDDTLWILSDGCTAGEAYVMQSLRWLHRVIEEGDTEALAKIIAQSKDEI